MKKTVKIILGIIVGISLFTSFIFAQDLQNPRIESFGRYAPPSAGDYLLFIDAFKYISKSDIELRDLKDLLKEWSGEKRKIAEQEKQLNEQKKEISELKKLISTQQRLLEEQKKQLDEQKRKISDLERKVK